MSKFVDVATVRTRVDSNSAPLLVDVRTPAEFESSHIPGAVNLPLGQLDQHAGRVARDTSEQVVLICQSGPRAEQAQTKLAAAGLSDSVVLSGGMNAWAAADAPAVHGRERWALERQVRLIAGSIVLVTALLSLWWTPAVFVAAFIGAGLTFAGLTNTCGMALMLAKLPYNQPVNKVDIEASLARMSRAGSRT
ncbi:rhodanese-like domain-containing protein [Nocardiopsis metallicus]|uniref:Rhodanese-related sulfurtransferase n=3 Tax=Nocardiopsis metallicus TaxID=179819 RepID=A0A840W8W0_9ACTN|nr:rhodanese-like domain-containing protein [Nocardiopsis metallicus]MBB5491803.1 rhodanese-related sulfurtransferase [Nocardiopsis metallicus]